MEVFMLLKLILKQQNHSQLYVAQHIIALYRCYRCCHFITGKTPNHREINQKDAISLECPCYNPSAILL